MFTTHDRRGGHRQAARNLMIAVATAAMAGGGAAIAADNGGAAPATAKAAAGGVEPAKTAQKTGERGPLAENEPIVTQARAALGRLVAEGAIDQAEADVVMRGVIAGRVDEEALVRAGKVAAAHMPAIVNVLYEVKRANAPAGGVEADGVKPANSAAFKRAKSAAVRRAKSQAGG
jgi:hypothetical protein